MNHVKFYSPLGFVTKFFYVSLSLIFNSPAFNYLRNGAPKGLLATNHKTLNVINPLEMYLMVLSALLLTVI